MHTEQKVAETILEKGVRVKLPAPFFIPFKKTISATIKQPTLGTLLKVAAIAIESGFDITALKTGEMNEAHELIKKHTKAIVKIVAAMMLNGRKKSALFGWMLERYLVNNLTARKVGEIALVTVAFSGVEDFTTTIRLIGAMRVTAPKNLSHEVSGSQQATPLV